MRTKYIVNPVAGRGMGKKIWASVQPMLDADGKAVSITRARGEAEILAGQAVREGYERIVAVGGDGTINEVVNGIAGAPVILGIIPAGTGNDFARSLGVPCAPEDACLTLRTGKGRWVDLGKANGKYFINVAGAGIDSEIVQAVNTDVRFLTGTAAYLYATVKTLFRFRPVEATLRLDEEIVRQEVLLVAVANGKYYGGGMMIAPTAVIDDGWFDVYVVGAMGAVECLKELPTIFSGRHAGHPKVSCYRVKKLVLHAARPIAVHLDGEIAGNLPVAFEILPHSLQIICPKRPEA